MSNGKIFFQPDENLSFSVVYAILLAYMKTLPPPITTETFEKILAEWQKIIKRQESGSIINLSKREQPYRINQLLSNQHLFNKFFKNISVLTVNLCNSPLEDEEDFNLYLKKNLKLKNKKVCLFILGADCLLEEKFFLLPFLNNLAFKNHQYSLLYIFQKNITLENIAKKLSPFSSLYQNIFIYPFYQEKDINQFIFYLEKKFSIKLPKNLALKIKEQCGGHLWLVKEAVRYYAKTKDQKNIFTHQEMSWRLKIIFAEFEEEERKVLEKVVQKNFNFTFEERAILDYFLKTKLIKGDGRFFSLTIPLMSHYLLNQLDKKMEISLDKNNQIMINSLVFDNFFSKRQKKLLKFFLKNKGKVISREKVAEVLWGENSLETYTDWALDQLIKRLRNKFLKLGLNYNLIKTKKKEGYIFNS